MTYIFWSCDFGHFYSLHPKKLQFYWQGVIQASYAVLRQLLLHWFCWISQGTSLLILASFYLQPVNQNVKNAS